MDIDNHDNYDEYENHRKWLTATEGPWYDNSIQFPRLLCEIVAAQEDLDINGIAVSMDLEPEDVYALLERAHVEWEHIKGNI